MIPVLAVPTLRPDLVRRMLASVDVEVGLRLVIDNSGRVGEIEGAWVVRLPANLGVSASWNLAMKLTPRAPWWAIVNDDLIFAPGDLTRLATAITAPGPRIVTMDGFAAFAINAEAHDTLGWFDENYVPCYVEDCDMERRARLAQVPIIRIDAGLEHARSSTIGMAAYRRQNNKSYPANVAYHRDKWGGGHRGGETFDRPFNREGVGPNEWTLDPRRLRELGWEVAMLPPAEDEVR